MNTKFLGLCLFFGVVGCAGPQWENAPDLTPQERTDVAQCRYEVNLATAGARDGLEQALNNRKLIIQCLRLRGYS